MEAKVFVDFFHQTPLFQSFGAAAFPHSLQSKDYFPLIAISSLCSRCSLEKKKIREKKWDLYSLIAIKQWRSSSEGISKSDDEGTDFMFKPRVKHVQHPFWPRDNVGPRCAAHTGWSSTGSYSYYCGPKCCLKPKTVDGATRPRDKPHLRLSPLNPPVLFI